MSTDSLPTDRCADSSRLQFELKSLLFGMTLLSIIFAVFEFVGVLWSVAITWFAVMVLAHIMAIAIGKHNSSPGAHQRNCNEPPANAAASRKSGLSIPAPSTQLRDRTRLGRGMLVTTGAGVLLGATAGSGVLALLYWGHVSLAAVVTGGISASILGGFLGFLLSSFVEVASSAMREAVRFTRVEPQR